MEEIIKNISGEPVYQSGRHIGYMVPWKRISCYCKKWSLNRDTDVARINEMIEFFERGGYLPPFIHLAELHDEGLVCYDGNHRREVFNHFPDKEITCIVDVIFNATLEEVVTEFNNINKIVMMPSIHLETDDERLITPRIKIEIMDLVKFYIEKYKKFVSSSGKPNPPNFNRDLFTENLTEIYKYFHGEVSIAELTGLLEKLNIAYSKNRLCRSHSTFGAQVIKKCTDGGLWLFLSRSIQAAHIEKIRDEVI